jgi:hypothetical protein
MRKPGVAYLRRHTHSGGAALSLYINKLTQLGGLQGYRDEPLHSQVTLPVLQRFLHRTVTRTHFANFVDLLIVG